MEAVVGAKTVLIVDDEAVIRETMQEAVALYGYNSVTAANGTEAIKLLSEKNDIDLILLDLMMPGMDGHQFMQHYENFNTASQVPIIIVSANRDFEMGDSKINIQGFLRKPIELDDLIDSIEKVWTTMQ